MNDFFDKITVWYENHCNGDWEHERVFKLENLDNPGWSLQIKGESNKSTFKIDKDISDNDWLFITATENSYTAAGGIPNLNEILENALKWLEIE